MSRVCVLGVFLVCGVLAGESQRPIQLQLDITDAPRRILHVTEMIPAHAGVNTISYPEWIPGEELPGGPIDNLAGLVIRAGGSKGEVLAWRRDLVDLYAFHIEVPEGTKDLWVAFDYLGVRSHTDTTGTNQFSSHVAMVYPSQVVLYPSGVAVREIPIAVTLTMPATWTAATALRAGEGPESVLNGSGTRFRTVSVEKFVDSPIVAGEHCRVYPLAKEIHPVHALDVCADKAEDLELQPALLEHMNALVRQTTRLFKGHHYEHYDFLVADSAHLDGDSLEHTESAGYVVKSLDVRDEGTASFLGYLLPHENTHSWCGKYRRPQGIATPDFHTPMQNDMIWVYEGLTQYYGDVLSVRAGFRSAEQMVGKWDMDTWTIDRPGRRWRSMQDVSDASAVLRGGTARWANWRLDQTEYYDGGAQLWLLADMKIRELSGGRKSLDDFAASFLGGSPRGRTEDTPAGVYPYSFADLVKALNDVTPYDWATFWTSRLNALTTAVPDEGLEAAGYSFVTSETIGAGEGEYLQAEHMADLYQSLGVFVLQSGLLKDVWMGSAAYAAGLGPGDKLTAVNGQPYTAEALVKAVRDAKGTTQPILLTAERNDERAEYAVAYHGGEKYKKLQRNEKPDVLTTKILRPL